MMNAFRLGLYGESGVGKSTVAAELVRMTGAKCRHCGEEVKKYAERINLSLDNLPKSVHEEIDRESRIFALGDGPLIIEGRYLDSVLNGVSGIVLFKLWCTEEVRLSRIRNREKGEENLKATAVKSQIFCKGNAHFVVDSSNMGAQQTAEVILNELRGCIR